MSDDLTTWLRRRIEGRRYLAQRTIELGNNEVWEEPSSGVLVTSEPSETDHWHGTWPMGDSSLARLMEANDPCDTLARCEAELAILDEYEAQDRDVTLMLGPDCQRLREWAGLQLTVRLLAKGYRHHPGYQEETRTCHQCGGTFTCNRYDNTKHCSLSCSATCQHAGGCPR